MSSFRPVLERQGILSVINIADIIHPPFPGTFGIPPESGLAAPEWQPAFYLLENANLASIVKRPPPPLNSIDTSSFLYCLY